MKQSQTQAQKLDANDPLAKIRDQFVLDDEEVYLDGNSLGPLLTRVRERLHDTIDRQWGRRLIRSWNEGWIDLPQIAAAKIAPIIGAAPANVICTDTVSVNIFKLLAASLMLSPERTVILSVRDMFPTDLYMSEGLAGLLGPERCELRLTEMSQLDQSLDGTVNVLLMSQVNFRTGEAYDVQAITERAHNVGARVLWDLSHSAGVLPIDVESNQVDFAVGCGYKFLNGGPGAPAFVFVDPVLQPKLKQPLTGWMGHKSPFDFSPQYEPAAGMDHFLAGTPGILGLSALDAALDLWAEVPLAEVFEKSQLLTQLFIDLIEQAPELQSLQIIKPGPRGSQVSLAHSQALPISQALIEAGLICDFRAPNLIRFGFAPLYTRYQDIATTVSKLKEIITSGRYKASQYQLTGKVT
ncbi:MAG: kynureninase [Candidatus Azotimanducaceae bacterium]|jgi:kynureninase